MSEGAPPAGHPVNSREWWEDYFAHHWEKNRGSEQTWHFMERLVASIPAPEAAFLHSRRLRILDWGCALGEGVQVLARAFPQSEVAGLDFSPTALAEAHRRNPGHEYLLSSGGEIPGDFDVIVTSNCLEHFEDPLGVAKRHLPACRLLYVALVPYKEHPLCEYHRVQLDEGSFPERLGSFQRLHLEPIAVDPAYWNGKQLLVLYGSPKYLQERIAASQEDQEREKWDQYYASLPGVEENPAVQAFGEELVCAISELLPVGGKVLEAGCGGGWQSAALARTGRYQVSVMDFSPSALAYAARVFERERQSADFIAQDVFTPGAPEFDLVLNAGALEHYTLDRQAAFLRGMASRSRKYVLALVPNRGCYWYWLWRIQAASEGRWPFGKEVPVVDLVEAFKTAGLHLAGQAFFGKEWVESFIQNYPKIDPAVRNSIVEIHRSPLIPNAQKSYLLGSLGSVSRRAVALPSRWRPVARPEDVQKAELGAALADALALRIGAEKELGSVRRALERETEGGREAQKKRQELEHLLTAERQARQQEAASNIQMRTTLRQLERTAEELSSQLESERTAREQEAAKILQMQTTLQELGSTLAEERLRGCQENEEAQSKLVELQRVTEELSSQLAAEQAARSREAETGRLKQEKTGLLESRVLDLSAQLSSERRALGEEMEKNRQGQAKLKDLEQAIQGFCAQRAAEQRAMEQELDQYRRHREELQGQVLAGVSAFEDSFQRELNIYRRQRAWKVMLFLRKAYRLLVRRGWLGKWEFLRWILRLPAGRDGLGEHDLTFPEVRSYLPIQTLVEAAPKQVARDPVPPPAKYDLVVLAIVDFDTRFQRPQQIASRFAREGFRVFWISPTRFLPAAGAESYQLDVFEPNLWQVRLRNPYPDERILDIYRGELSEEHAEALAHSLDELYADMDICESVCLIQLPFWRRLGLELRAEHKAPLIYDCMDEWETFPHIGEFNISEEGMLAAECDGLSVTAQRLYEKFARRGNQPVLVRNAADFDRFRNPQPESLPPGCSRPVIGYFGAIADWVDLELIAEVARLRPSYSFVLVGQVFGRDTSPLEALPNVFLLGNQPYGRIPGFLACFDACIIPFVCNQVTQATDPVKLYEYFTQGKPVVATRLAELEIYNELLYLAQGAHEFAARLDEALQESTVRPHLAPKRIEVALANTWWHRVAALDSVARKCLPLISILIVTHNSGAHLQACLDSIISNTAYPSYEILILDNNSSDNTFQILARYFSLPNLRVYCLPANLGFAAANNVGLRHARGEYVQFLNPDTVVPRGWLWGLLRHLWRDPRVGQVCPATNFAGNEVKIDVNYTDMPSLESFARRLARERRNAEVELSVAPLFCALMRRNLLNEIGGLDERFSVGMFEDDDLSLRVKAAGFRIVCAEDCFVHHFGQGSFSALPPDEYLRIFESNRQAFEEKWRLRWKTHRLRPGLDKPWEEPRLDPSAFLRK